MKSVALITEYNPFHNGHLYHAQQSKYNTDADVVIAIMSGQFMMRGMPAMYSKFIRTQMALTGVDLVVELPLLGCLSSSDRFAEMGVKVANYLEADTLSFGSESGNLHELQKVCSQLIVLEQDSHFQTQLKEGKHYARIIGEKMRHPLLNSPNNILALSYLKQLHLQRSPIQPITIPRIETKHHQHELTHETLGSGSAIRKDILSNGAKWQHCVPSDNINLFHNPFNDYTTLFQMIKLSILQQDVQSLASIYTMSEGFEHRLKRTIHQANDYDTLLKLLKTKRYTHTHIQRVLMNVLLHFTYNDVNTDVKAVRILGMNVKGQAYLKQVKQRHPEKKFITNVNKATADYFKNEIKATHIYNLLTGEQNTDFNTPVIIHNNSVV